MKISNSATLYNGQKYLLSNQTVYSFKGENRNSQDEFTKSTQKEDEFLAEYTPATHLGKLTKWVLCSVDKYIVPLDNRKKLENVQYTTLVDTDEDVPQEYIDLFEELKDYDGNMFFAKAFLSLSKMMGVDDIAIAQYFPIPTGTVTPDLNISINTSSRTRNYYEYVNQDDSRKWGELCFIAGGLKQIQQYCDILRLGDDAIGIYKEKYRKLYEEEYGNQFNLSKDEIRTEIDRQNINKVKILPPHVSGSKEEEHAIRLLDAFQRVPHTYVSGTRTNDSEINSEIKAIQKKKKKDAKSTQNDQLVIKMRNAYEMYPFKERFIPKTEVLKGNLALEEKNDFERKILEYVKKWQESKDKPDEKILSTVNKCLELVQDNYDKYLIAYSDTLTENSKEHPPLHTYFDWISDLRDKS